MPAKMALLFKYSNVLIFVLLLLISTVLGYNLTVKTENGYVKGHQETGPYNVSYFAFKGIPFAEPPIGKLRIKDPVPVSSWEGVKETTAYQTQCASKFSTYNIIIGQEDCLYLNIFVPYTDQEIEDLSLPVMVWIHGGGFYEGAPSYYDPSYLLKKPVIVASVAYRLGVLGFLSTLDENARGNAGLKDQNLALEWIHNNIEYFGGNASRITIFGQSAGGASIDYQVISPKSNGLFSQAISESGSALNQWALQRDPLAVVYDFSKAFNITSRNTTEIVAALQEVDLESLVLTAINLSESFLPVIEREGEEAFLSRSAYDIWESGDFNRVPFMVGYVIGDGSVVKELASNISQDPRNVIPSSLNLDLDSEEAQEVLDLVSQRYFPNNSYDNFARDIEFFTQAYFVRGIRKTMEEYVKFSSPLYFYKFTYLTKANYSFGVLDTAGHGDELLYLFALELVGELAETDIIMRDRMVTLWTNFAIYGNPTPEKDDLFGNVIWPEATAGIEGEDDVQYLEIGDSLTPGANPDQEDYLFWKGIFQKYAVQPLQTY